MPTTEAERVRTGRLVLTPAAREEAAAIAATANDRAVLHNLSFLIYPVGADDIARLIEEQPGSDLWLTVRLQDGEEIIGVAGIHTDADGGAEIGFWLAPAHWGQGYATEIGRALARLARDRGLDPVWAVVLPDNAGSCRVLEKAGFVRDGEAVRYYRQRAAEQTVHRYRLPGDAG